MYSSEYEQEEQEVSDSSSSGNFYQNNRILVWIFIAVIIIAIVVVIFKKKGDNGGNNDVNVNKYSISIIPEDDIIVAPGKSYKLEAVVSENANALVTWTSSDESIATVSDGNVTGVKYGKAVISATYTHTDNLPYTARKQITVADGTKDVLLTDVSIKKGILIMPTNGTYSIVLDIVPTDAYIYNKVFTSSNENIVTVNETGFVQAVGEGDAIITIVVNDSITIKLNVVVDNDYMGSEIVTEPTGIGISKEIDKIKVGATAKIEYTIEPEEANKMNVTWTSSNSNVIEVDKNGIITALKEGTATITATVNGIKDSVSVEVEPETVSVTDMQMLFSDLALEVGQSQNLMPTISPDNATDKTIKCTSSDQGVVTASVSSDGTSCDITALSEGTAMITLESNDNSAISKIVNITVSKATTDSGSGGGSCGSCNNKKCGAGKYCSCGKCYTCQAGYRCDGNKRVKCPDGYTSDAGSSYCKPTSCPAGLAANDPLIGGCAPCGKGYYSPANDTKCYACPTGWTTSKSSGAASSSDCNTCKDGYWKSGSTCKLCDAPYYCKNNTRYRCPNSGYTEKSGAKSKDDCSYG